MFLKNTTNYLSNTLLLFTCQTLYYYLPVKHFITIFLSNTLLLFTCQTLYYYLPVKHFITIYLSMILLLLNQSNYRKLLMTNTINRILGVLVHEISDTMHLNCSRSYCLYLNQVWNTLQVTQPKTQKCDQV